MAIPWLVVLQSVPWTDVIRNAPKVADGAKKLWNTVNRKTPAQESPAAEKEAPLANDAASITLLQKRVAKQETAIAELHEQMRASSELIKTLAVLAEQNTLLVERVEASRVRVVRVVRLAWATSVLGIIVFIGIAFLLMW